MANTTKKNLEQLERYLRNGVCLVLDGYDPAAQGEKLGIQQLKAMGFTHLRLAKKLYMKQETANLIAQLQQEGFTVLGGNADDHEVLRWLIACGVSCSSGTITGVPVTDDELIRDRLVAER